MMCVFCKVLKLSNNMTKQHIHNRHQTEKTTSNIDKKNEPDEERERAH